jgi:mono/diheme cytochrome c family protein
MKLLKAAFPLLMTMVVAGPALAQKGDAKLGKAAYTKSCATCHGAEGEGKPAIAKLMKVDMRHLGAKDVQGLSDAEVSKIITEGKGKMKPPKDMKEADVANVLAYFRTLSQK